MSVYYHSTGGGKNRRDDDWWGWLPIIILFCIPTPVTWIVAFFLLVDRLRGGSRRKGVKRHPYDIQQDKIRQEEQRARKASPTRTEGGGRSQTAAGKSRRVGGAATGKGMILLGAIIIALFGMGALTTFVEAVSYGVLKYNLGAIVSCAVLMAAGLVTLGIGVGRKRRAERYSNYLAYIGANREIPLAHMAASFGLSVRKLCKELRQMLSTGVLPTGYLDLAEGKLYLTEMGYRAPEPEKREKKEEETGVKTDDDAILREIRQINDAIPGEEMSAKIDRIEEITRKILVYQKQHPERAGQLRSFLNYYLPTTLKILRAYAQLDAQGIEGENISAAKARIEGMMDQVVAGFEKQLDKLFQDDALDITADVNVLENMLRKDGLSGDDGVTMRM